MAIDQRIRDPLHNLIKFSANIEDDKVLWELLQSRPVQRLRRIKQLGFSDFVYPGASHSRLSHSLGAMEVARRMLEVLTKNKVIQTDKDYPLWHRATLCAALLHDIGHGPYSHVFEAVSFKFGHKIDHEDYTLRLIQETEIADILNKNSEDLLEKTVSLFKEEPGEHIFSSIISSQLDADRLDFLRRDRYFTGIRFGEIDLEWIFDSLRVQNVPADIDSEVLIPTFVISAKGLSAAEEYLSSYSHMYSSVYFHKTTRGIEVLVSEILHGIFSDREKYIDNFSDDPLFEFLNSEIEPDISQYLTLDDNSIITFIKRVAVGDFGQTSLLAQRFLDRNLFKCFEPPKDPQAELPSVKIASFRKKIKEEGIQHFENSPPQKGYKQFDISNGLFLQNILVESRNDGEPRPIVSLSPAVKFFAEKLTIRFYFLSSEDRETAKKLWNDL